MGRQKMMVVDGSPSRLMQELATLARATPAPKAETVQTAAGLIVSPEVAATLKTATGKAVVAYDHDGRRRVVFSKQDRRTIKKAFALFRSQGFAVGAFCDSRPDGKEPCGGRLQIENERGADDGIGCGCSRIHYTDV